MAIKKGSCFGSANVFVKIVGPGKKPGECRVKILVPKKGVLENIVIPKEIITGNKKYRFISSAGIIRIKISILRELRNQIEQIENF